MLNEHDMVQESSSVSPHESHTLDGDGDFVGAENGGIGVEAETETIHKFGRCPEVPTPEEYAEHQKTHIPYKPWCRVCVMNKAKNNPHKKQTSSR